MAGGASFIHPAHGRGAGRVVHVVGSLSRDAFEGGGERAVVVVVRGNDDATAIGAALSGSDSLRAAANAALEATARLPR